jgi:hypothetical protein
MRLASFATPCSAKLLRMRTFAPGKKYRLVLKSLGGDRRQGVAKDATMAIEPPRRYRSFGSAME